MLAWGRTLPEPEQTMTWTRENTEGFTPAGGCTALVRTDPDGTTWQITVPDEPRAPETMEEAVELSQFNRHGEFVEGWPCDSVYFALGVVHGVEKRGLPI